MFFPKQRRKNKKLLIFLIRLKINTRFIELKLIQNFINLFFINLYINNKIIFWQSGDWFNYALANSLQKHGFELFAIIDIADKPKKFFEAQKFVSYKKIWFYNDNIKKRDKPDLNYLKEIETKYNINLWLLAYNERIFYNYNPFYKFTTNEVLSILEQECRLFESILNETKPDFLIISLTTFHSNHLFYEMCKARGIKVLMIGPSEFGFNASRLIISEEVRKIDYLPESLESDSNTSFIELQDHLKKRGTYKSVIKYKNQFNKLNLSRLRAGMKFIFSKNTNVKTHYAYYGRTRLKVIKHEIISLFKTKLRERFINKNFTRKIENEKFFYFPLHVDQERSLLIGSPFFTNQLEVIKHIVKSLPIGYKLYVKEHPSMKTRDWRSISYYKEIMSLPNICLIHPSLDSEELIIKCSLLISISGTAAFEAAFYGKPSIIFTEYGQRLLSSFFKVNEIDNLPNIIKQALEFKANANELSNYVKIIEKNSFDFDYIDFILDYGDHFYEGGNLVDVKISNEKMKRFLEKYEEIFDKLAIKYIEKINQHNTIDSKR